MKRDKIYEDLYFTTDFSVENWNALLKLKLGKYFLNKSILEKNKEILRTEIINYIRFCNKPEYLKLFEWTFDLYKDCIVFDKQKVIKVLADSFDYTSNTDMKWMTNVLTGLNYIEEIITELGTTENMNIRFESSLLHIIHNMQIVGFKFVSNEEVEDVFCLNIKGKVDHDVKSSLIHASQYLDQLSCAIYDDKFVRDNFKRTRINIVDENRIKLASATISIEVALSKAKGHLTLDEYLGKMEFEIKNYT